MPQIINTNIASLTAQRNLNTSQNDLNTSLQRLSSGLRINSAKDDAAGLAISERFTTQIRGLNQAQRNANDGISLAQSAEGDLAQITNNLQRIRELAVQSANATNSASDREALQLETAELIAEIDRVASTSSFNGVKLLDGSFASQQFQVGANAGETVDIASIASSRTAALGQTNGAVLSNTGSVTSSFASGDLTVNGSSVSATADAKAIADAITALDGDLSATATNVQTGIQFSDVDGTNLAAGAATSATYTFAAAVTTFDYSQDSASFTVDGNTVTLDGSYGNQLGVAAKIQTDLGGDYSVTETGGVIEIATTATGSGETAPVIAGFDGNLDGGDADSAVIDFVTGTNAIGDGSNPSVYTATNALAGLTDDAAGYDFSVDTVSFGITDATTATVVTLNTDLTDQTGFLAEINSQLVTGGTDLVASVSGGDLIFTRTANGADAISVTTPYNGNVDGGVGTVADFSAGGTSLAGVDGSAYSLSIDGTALDFSTVAGDDVITAAETAGLINALSAYTASAVGSTLSITKADGSNVVLAESGATSGVADGLNLNSTVSGGTSTTYRGVVDSVTNANGEVVIGGTSPSTAGFTAGTTAVDTSVLLGATIENTDISTLDGANAAIQSIDSALSTINTSRASLGAIQNRFESVVSSIQTTSENLSAARSRIRDTDFAEETAALTRAQILQQAGVSILSQANSLPQNVLALLQ